MNSEKQPGNLFRLHCVRRVPTSGNLRAHSLLFSSPCSSSNRAAVHRRSVRYRSRVLRPVHLLHLVLSQSPHFRRRADGVDADGGRDRIPSLNQSPRKTLLKMTLQSSWLCGIYSRLIPPQARPVSVRNFHNAYQWDVLLEDFLPMFSLSTTSSLQTTAGLDLGPPLRRRTPCGVLPWS